MSEMRKLAIAGWRKMKFKIEKCHCGYWHIYRKSWRTLWKWKPMTYLYREVFCEALINRSFENKVEAMVYLDYPLTNPPRIVSGEYASGKNENIC